ncbi:MAG: methyltransferase domain-containing protein [Planctomycetota bacterium]|jgi:hypothetical protein
MIQKIIRGPAWLVKIWYERYKLHFCKTKEEVEEYARANNENQFLHYLGGYNSKVKVFESLVQHFELDLSEKKVLDIGQGIGHYLDVAKEMGASVTEFVDYAPLYVKYSKVKGHDGWLINYKLWRGFKRMLGKCRDRYDLIISKGSIDGDYFNQQFEKKRRFWINLPKWLDQVESMLAPRGLIVITPTWDRGPEPPYHTCRDLDGFKRSPFMQEMTSRGYETTFVEDYNYGLEFPITFYKWRLEV